MKILGLETSAKAASCALYDGGVLVSEFFLNAGLTHSKTIMPMVEAMLKLAGISAKDIDLFAVSDGPGSFTGVRIGISAVKGMAAALDKPCAGVSSLEALARNVTCFQGIIVPVMDARRAQVYTSVFSSGQPAPVRQTKDMAISIDALCDELKTRTAPCLLLGDGAELCFERLSPRLDGLLLAPEGIRHQRAASVCLAAMDLDKSEYKTPDALEPAYLRLPQAERERMERAALEKRN